MARISLRLLESMRIGFEWPVEENLICGLAVLGCVQKFCRRKVYSTFFLQAELYIPRRLACRRKRRRLLVRGPDDKHIASFNIPLFAFYRYVESGSEIEL